MGILEEQKELEEIYRRELANSFKYCVKCGHRLDIDTTVCPRCGCKGN